MQLTRCNNCGAVLNESPELPVEERKPCPNCGSSTRTYDIAITESAGATDFAFVTVTNPVVDSSAKLLRSPSLEQVESLPRWARVAFAARCARRVAPLFRKFWPDAPLEFDAKLEMAVSTAEKSAGQAGRDINGGEVTTPASAIICANYACDAVMAALRDRDRVKTVLEAVPRAIVAFTKQANEAETLPVIPVIAHNAALAIAQSNAEGSQDYKQAIQTAEAAIRHDFQSLLELANAEKWDDATPVGPDRFGPLWVTHSELPERNTSEIALPDLELYIDPGEADAEVVADVLIALSELNKAAGGLGLSYKITGTAVSAAQEVRR